MASLLLGRCPPSLRLGVDGGAHLFANSAVWHLVLGVFALVLGVASGAETLRSIEVVFQVPNQDCTIFAAAGNRRMDWAPT